MPGDISSEFFATLLAGALPVTGGVAAGAGGAGVSVTAGGFFAPVATDGATVTIGGSISAPTSGLAVTDGGFVASVSGGEIFATSGRLVISPATGGFIATATLGTLAVSVTENALSTIAHAKSGDFQRCGDIGQKAPAFQQELGVRAV